jgi:hypothetical protein
MNDNERLAAIEARLTMPAPEDTDDWLASRMAMVAHAREDIPWLVAKLREAWAERDAAEAVVEAWLANFRDSPVELAVKYRKEAEYEYRSDPGRSGRLRKLAAALEAYAKGKDGEL